MSVNAVKVRCDVDEEESQSEEEGDNGFLRGESRVRTTLKIQNEAVMIKDIGDLNFNRRQKIRLKHINEPSDGQIQDLEALIRTRNVPCVSGAAGMIDLNDRVDNSVGST